MELSKDNLNKFLTCIEFPGIVENVDKALKTLGGISEISKAVSQETKRLELKFRPDDIFCKPACGDRYETYGIVLKVRIKKKKRESGEVISTANSCEVLGRVVTTYRFKSICDFQYLPILRAQDGGIHNISESILPERLDGDHLLKWLEKPMSYFLPPVAFSRMDVQSLNSYMFRRGNGSNNEANGSLIGRTRKRRSGHAIFVSFKVPKVPSKPRAKALKFVDLKFLNDHLEQMKKCFEERPVWSKLGLICVTSFNYDQMKYLLPSVAYYFVNGPFRVMWVRFGYDPRKDPTARIYQTLDYRIRAPAGLLSLVKVKRNDTNNTALSKPSQVTEKSFLLSKNIEETDTESQVPEEKIKKDSFIYQPNSLPPARQMFYQYCDIKVPEIEDMIDRLPKVVDKRGCDPKNGWLPFGFDNQCREIINTCVNKQLSKESFNFACCFENDQEIDDLSDNEENWEEVFDEEDIDCESDNEV